MPSLIASSGTKDMPVIDRAGVSGPRSAREGVSITGRRSGWEGKSAGGSIAGNM